LRTAAAEETWLWLLLVMVATAVAGYFGQLPGVEPRPYILRFTEDKPNPLYRKICYTFAWNAVITFTLLNLAGLVIAAATGKWVMKQLYLQAYFPLCAIVLLLGLFRPAAQSGAFDQGRGHRAAIFLRGGVGGGDFADHSAAAVEDAAPVAGDEPDQAGSLCAELVRGGRGGRPGDAAPHPAHRSRPADGGRLAIQSLSCRVPRNRRVPHISLLFRPIVPRKTSEMGHPSVAHSYTLLVSKDAWRTS
jgi:hypothetical protein